MSRPKLKDKRSINWPYEIDDISKEKIFGLAKEITYHLYVDDTILGDKWADIFSKSVKGVHLNKPIGHVDVVYKDMAWSVKTISDKKPHEITRVRIISGRNAPNYSFGIDEFIKDPQKTGDAVLSIWNERFRISLQKYPIRYRMSIMVRNEESREFAYFENEGKTYDEKDYSWFVNSNKNLEGYNIKTREHTFTWQPNGAQFTIIYPVPKRVVRFSIKRSPRISLEEVIQAVNFKEDWVEFK